MINARTLRNMIIQPMVMVGLISVSLVGCNNGGNTALEDAESKSTKQFEAFLKLKHLTPRDEKQRESILQEYLDREALAATIESQKILDADMVAAEINEFRKEMLISRYFEKFLADAVSDQAVLNYYNSHVDEFETKKAHVAHILIRTHKNMDEATRKVKLTTAQEAYAKINAGEDFAEIAKKYSEDVVSGKKGGDLGWLIEGAIDKRFSDVVFAMEKSSVSEPFETEFGFHVVKLVDGPAVVKQPFESVKGRIRHQLRVEAKDAELKRLLSMAKAGE